MLKYQFLFNKLMSKKTRPIVFVIFFGVFLLSYMIGTSTKMTLDQAIDFANNFERANQGIDSIGLFLHNASVGVPMFIPAMGAAWGAYTGWQTGEGFAAIVKSNPDLATLSPLTLILGTPFGILEIIAYSIGMSRSFLVVWNLVKKKSLKAQLKPGLIEVGIVIILLLVAGFAEFSAVHHASS
jgi:hypothetical protein